jgi:hypothetical protein
MAIEAKVNPQSDVAFFWSIVNKQTAHQKKKKKNKTQALLPKLLSFPAPVRIWKLTL